MDGVTSLIAALLTMLRAVVGGDVPPSSWAWAVSLLGIGVGLLPAVGAVIVALLRKRIGSHYGVGGGLVVVGTGLLFGGLLPWLAFVGAGTVLSRAAGGPERSGLSRDSIAELAEPVPGVPFADLVVDTQGTYLGRGSVAAAFDPANPALFVVALVGLAGIPLVTAAFVAVQARLALRRGPMWPSKFFWAPTLALALLTASTPAGSSGHLWLGAVTGAFLGIFVVLLFGVPSRETVRRSLEPAAAPRPATPPPSPPIRTPARRRPDGAAPEDVGGRRLSDRLAQRFSARPPEPPVVPQPGPAPIPNPTLVAPAGFLGSGTASGTRFQLVRRLGEGGFGKVWLAHDAKLGHQVALKAAHAPDAETEQRLRREATALGAVRHPHCVRIHELVDSRSDPGLAELDGMVIVMEYVEGQSLGELVRGRGVLDDIAAARVWASVAGALDAAHQMGVMHRDVKPGNVVVDPSGLAHLIDFGIARRTGDATLTMAGFVLGTPDFLAPEVAGGQRATPSSDAWQLAATIAYALTGHPPRGGHPDAISGLRAAAAGAPLTHLPPRSAHLALLHASMHNDPAQRPSLREARHALENWLQRAGARPDGPVTVVTTRR
ncbi:serine/threonine-protein kinase [Pseudonocardia sp.]|uniref:serine/threonine-protein kinase n=1 Tax=Pseudonocardia sp. TaxID=60912 RepID=UPI0026278C42|nr:serine/threonine-protein kinase [Pseudonocardia sp.]